MRSDRHSQGLGNGECHEKIGNGQESPRLTRDPVITIAALRAGPVAAPVVGEMKVASVALVETSSLRWGVAGDQGTDRRTVRGRNLGSKALEVIGPVPTEDLRQNHRLDLRIMGA